MDFTNIVTARQAQSRRKAVFDDELAKLPLRIRENRRPALSDVAIHSLCQPLRLNSERQCGALRRVLHIAFCMGRKSVLERDTRVTLIVCSKVDLRRGRKSCTDSNIP